MQHPHGEPRTYYGISLPMKNLVAVCAKEQQNYRNECKGLVRRFSIKTEVKQTLILSSFLSHQLLQRNITMHRSTFSPPQNIGQPAEVVKPAGKGGGVLLYDGFSRITCCHT